MMTALAMSAVSPELTSMLLESVGQVLQLLQVPRKGIISTVAISVFKLQSSPQKHWTLHLFIYGGH